MDAWEILAKKRKEKAEEKNSNKTTSTSSNNAWDILDSKRSELGLGHVVSKDKDSEYVYSEEGKLGWQKYLEDDEVKRNETVYGKEDEKWWETLGRWLGNGGAVDTTLPNAGVTQTIHDLRVDTSYMRPQSDWSEAQKNEFGALYLKSPSAAYEYATETNKKNNKAKEEAQVKAVQDSATDNFLSGVGHTLGSIASAPLGLADFLQDLAYANAGREIAPDGNMSPFEYSQAVTGGIGTHLNEEYGTIDEDIPIIGGKGWGDAYGLGTSIAQSAMSAYTLGGAGTLVSYFGQGAAAGVDDALSRGASEDQAVVYGTVLGVAEGLAEKIGIDNLFKLGASTTVKETIKNILKQAGAEGLEEGLTSLISNIADNAIMQDKSSFNAIVQQYIAQGMSETDAKKKAWIDSIEGIAYDTLGGFVSGGVHAGAYTGGQTAVSNHNASKLYGDQSQMLIDDALSVQNNSELRSLAEQYEGRVKGGKNLTGGQINRLIEQTDTAKLKSSILRRLGELGETSDVTAIADVLVRQAMGEVLTSRDTNILNDSKAGYKVLNEINKENIKSGALANDWASKIGTRRINPEAYNKELYDLASQKSGMREAVEKNSVAKTIAESETATGTKFKASEDGTTFDTATGEEVSINKIISTKGGKVMVELDNGSTVDASTLSLASSEEAVMYEMVAKMEVTPDTANEIISTFKPSNAKQSLQYLSNVPLAYQYGKMGYEAGLANINLTEQQKRFAYNRGRLDAESEVKSQPKSTVSKKNKAQASKTGKNGIIYEDGFTYDESTANDMQKVSMAHIEVIGKMSNLEVHVFESKMENGKRVAYVNGKRVSAPNGYFTDGNKIYIDFNAGNNGEGAMLYTMSHEVTHYIRKWNAKGFKELGDFLIEQYGKQGVPVNALIEAQKAKIKKRYKEEGKALPSEAKLFDMAYEELVADAMSDMFADPNAYEKLAKLKKKDVKLWQKLGEAIKAVLGKLKAALGIYKTEDVPVAREAFYVRDFSSEVYEKLQDLYIKAFVEADANYEASIGSRNLNDFADAKNENGEPLFQYRAMEADEETYRHMLHKWGKMTNVQIDNLFATIDNAMELIKDNLEVLDYAWEADIDDRAFSPVKPNSDKLYQVSLDFSTLCRKRILQQTVQVQLQEALNKPLTREEGIAIRDALMALQEEGRQIEVACALCYVESARMKSPEQIKKFINNKEKVIKDFFANKSGGNIKEKIKQAEADARARLGVGNASLKSLPGKVAQEIREAKKVAKESYKPTAEEQKLIDVAKGMTVTDFTSPEGLENLAKNYPRLFDAYTSYIRNATKSKGIEGDTWWRAGDSNNIGDVLIANMNKENGLRSQSWSDFQVIHILDYIASTIELATRNTKEQAYSKVPDYVELMGLTGVMINMSLIPTAQFNGSLDYDSVEGIDYKRALELRDKYHATAGTICIGVDNVQIKLLLGDATIDYVIPYHRSGMSKALRKLMHIPTWSDYELYQSESNLSRADAEKQAEKYGVQLLDVSDPNYQRGTSFSEWFNLQEAQQIAKMENANPSDKAKHKKYGVMYGGYMAMQNAANNYLKLCAERGIAPKFSNEKADFTAEDNYWKLLIDRKMVDNVTGEVIEQQTIKPIFNEGEIMRILNDELARYPKVKADQDYAIRRVTEKMLSGEIRGGMSAKDIAKVMQKPVDNVTNVNILASVEDMEHSDRDSHGNELSAEQQKFFKDSKARDEDGNLLVLFHGTSTENRIAEFMTTEAWRTGLWLTTDHETSVHFARAAQYIERDPEDDTRLFTKENSASGSGRQGVYELYANVKNPLIVDAQGKRYWEIPRPSAMGKGDVVSGEEINAFALDNGYDGVIINDVVEGSNRMGTDVIVFSPNQVKYTDNLNPTEGDDIRYSDRDTLGNELSPEQQEYFKDSKVRDKKGNLMVLYHGTTANFNTFKKGDVGFHFGTKGAARGRVGFGKNVTLKEVYLNITNPIVFDEDLGSWDADWRLTRELYDMGILTQAEAESVLFTDDRRYKRTTEAANKKLASVLLDKGYDGIQYSNTFETKKATTSYIVFNSNQAKEITNKTPTSDPDIRYSDRTSYAPTFYSHMGKVIGDIRLDKMGAGGVVSYLKGKGVKDEEIKWSGIETFLEGKKSVTKAELQEFIAGSQLQIVEQMSDNEEYTRWSDYKLEGGSNYRELVFQMPNSWYSNNAMRAHWGEDAEGVLAHARIQDFNVNGKKMLFIEELQSDWHNEGLQSGYIDSQAEAEIDKLKSVADEKFFAVEDYSTEMTGLAGEWETIEKTEKGAKLLSEYREARDSLDQAMNKWVKKIPDAPFRNTYHEYVLKRLLRMAAEEGYDSIGWTPADIQSKRWSEDYAEAYRIEYDQDIPKFLRKYGKKWGATVGKSYVNPVENSKEYIADNEKDIEEYKRQIAEIGEDASENEYIQFLTEGIADLQANIEKYKGTKVWSMDIPDSMKDSVLYEGQVLYSDRVTDQETLDFLENQEHVTVYRAMQVIEGELYPPMAAKVKSEDGKNRLVTPSEIGAWEQAVERPDLIYKGNKFKLDKANGSSIDAAYNPYFHTSASPLNDQFSSAYKRPNLVIVEGEIPKSELTSGYRAKFAKDTVGETKWHSGPVAGKLKGDKARRVFLSRWFKPVRIVPDSEVASIVAKTLEGENIDVPYNVVTPSLRAELEKVGVPIKYSDRDPDAVSNRTLLANALESVAQNDIEKNKLTQYKKRIALIESEQAKLTETRAKIKELSFAKGARDTEAIKKLQFEANQSANRINTYDRQLLDLESTTALKRVLEREKEMARKKAEQKGKDALRAYKEKAAKTQRALMDRYTESRKSAIEGRNKTAMRHKIKDVVSDLNKLLLNPTKDQHVPIGLQQVVAEALDAINMDTMNAEERVAYYNVLISKATDPDEIAMLTKKRDFFEYRSETFKDRITALKNAYAEFKESDDPLIRNAHNDAIEDLIKNTADAVGNKSLKDMSLEQLEAVYDMYKAIRATVKNANKMFKEGRQQTVSENSEAVKEEVREVGGHKDRVLKITKFLKKFGWNMLKPITAMKAIGSKTFAKLFDNVRAGEDTWAVDVNEAKEFFNSISEKYGYKKWDFKSQYTFKDSKGNDFSISLEQMMSLYAYSKREQADKHLEFGGFIFDDAIEVTVNKLGIPLKYEVNDANPYTLKAEQIAEVISKLTSDQKGFIDEMQTYLSETMGAKGNEVSLALYDIKLYKEKNYFPLKTARYFREFDPEQSATPKIKNSGFSKKTVPKAGNPIVLSNFMDVWASHVNDMSMYHAFVLPLEDFMRVYNYSSTAGGYDSVQQYIKNAYGSQANQYIERLMDDLNGGARVDSSADVINKGLSLFKKASVFASASVVVQQPSAIARAFAYINPKHFATSAGSALNLAKHKSLWAEIKKYAPVAVIKEMGYFDTGMGRSTVEWIKGNQTIKDKVDDALAKAPAIADELSWSYIWLAVKNEVKSTTNLTPGTEEFLKRVGERFTEIITNTQVYDSVLARSGMMRSKDTGVKMVTAFMAEPTTTVNMMVDGILQGKRGNKKFTAATVGAVSSSIILNSILVALVYAARDDDEDETYAEKYIGSLTTELLDGFNPITYLPFFKDAWSILQGFDVERADMTLITKLVDSLQQVVKVLAKDTDNMSEDELNEYHKDVNESILSIIDNATSIMGVPIKNIRRDINAIINTTKTLGRDDKTTEGSLKDTIEGAMQNATPVWGWFPDESKTDKLYDAIVSGDEEYRKRIEQGYKDSKAYESAVKSALREHDSRIHEAAQARYEGDIATYTRIAKEIIAEGNFSQDTVVGAINSEISAIKKGESVESEPTEEKDEETSIYKASDINTAFDNGDSSVALDIIADLVKTKVANGMTEKEANSSLRSSMTSYWKPLYIQAYHSGNSTETARIRKILYASGLYGNANDVVTTTANWLKN